MKLEKRYQIKAAIIFETAFHIGAGKGGSDTVSDMGVLKDPFGLPILPGSSIKGKFRSTVERLAYTIGKTACMLDSSLSGINCVSDEDYRKKLIDQYKAITSGQERLNWLHRNTCDVCKLFGSPLKASRIFFSDGILNIKTWAGVTQTRDGVVIDRDSETAVDRLKYDYEVIPPGAEFDITIDIENPTETDLALIELGLAEWEKGVMLGGFTSRGLGRAKLALNEEGIKKVDFNDPNQRLEYLKNKTMMLADREEFRQYLSP